MSISKEWKWEDNKETIWFNPSEESYRIASRWKDKGYKDLLDFGCGMGRHSIFFAKNGFNVSAFDLSEYGLDNLNKWAKNENLNINITKADMLSLPYDDSSFDCLFAYHVISHTDSKGILKIVSELGRVLKEGGEFYLSLCSKDTYSFKEAGYPVVDENTIIKTEGVEKDVPHFYVDIDDILSLFADFEIHSIRHVDECYYDGVKRNSKHYFILGEKE